MRWFVEKIKYSKPWRLSINIMYVHCTYMYLRCPDVFLFLSKLNEVITLHSIHYYGTIYNTLLFSTRITVPRNTIVPKHNDAHIKAAHNIYNICAVSKQHRYYEGEAARGGLAFP